MAINQDKWDKARTLFESGKLSLSEISKETGIDKSTISKKAKNQQWKSGEEADYIEAKILIAEKKSTLPIEKINILDDVANDEIRRRNLIFGNAEKLAQKIDIMTDEVFEAKDIKDLVDANDKLSITLGVNQRHSNSQVNIQNTNAVQTNNNIDIENMDAKQITNAYLDLIKK